MANIGHGWVFPREDGARARCGGPALCPECQEEHRSTAGALRARWEPASAGLCQALDAAIEAFAEADEPATLSEQRNNDAEE